jgi:hypothetical protein
MILTVARTVGSAIGISRIKRRKSVGRIGLEYNLRPGETEAQAACLVGAIR